MIDECLALASSFYVLSTSRLRVTFSMNPRQSQQRKYHHKNKKYASLNRSLLTVLCWGPYIYGTGSLFRLCVFCANIWGGGWVTTPLIPSHLSPPHSLSHPTHPAPLWWLTGSGYPETWEREDEWETSLVWRATTFNLNQVNFHKVMYFTPE